MVTPIPFLVGFGVYLLVFLAGLMAGLFGLISGPSPRSRRLCKWNLWITGSFTVILTGILLTFALGAACRGNIEPGAVLLFINLCCFPLLLVFFGLLAVWFWRVSPPDA